jgi:hypothetical protein
MSEVTDIVVPILQKLQADVADVKRDLKSLKEDVSTEFKGLLSRMEAHEGYFNYTMGLTRRNAADIERMQAEFNALVDRLASNGT